MSLFDTSTRKTDTTDPADELLPAVPLAIRTLEAALTSGDHRAAVRAARIILDCHAAIKLRAKKRTSTKTRRPEGDAQT
jgi:hypothetical protein